MDARTKIEKYIIFHQKRLFFFYSNNAAAHFSLSLSLFDLFHFSIASIFRIIPVQQF
jgi:hypothetical protein